MISLNNVDLAFSIKSKTYDEYGKSNIIVKFARSKVRQEILSHLSNHDRILEINGGTGSDALFLATKGYQVHMIDISKGMIEKAQSKITSANIGDILTVERKSFNNLTSLPNKNYNYIFSNFGGLNCTPNIKQVISQFPQLLQDGGYVTLIVMPPFCPWELLNIFWNPKMALRRIPALFGTRIKSNISGIKFWTYYYSVNKIKKMFDSNFTVVSLQSMSLFSPPSFLDYFPVRYPKLFRFLLYLDEWFSKSHPFNTVGDYFILTLRYNELK